MLYETAYRAVWVTRSRHDVAVSGPSSRCSYRLRRPHAFAGGSSSRALPFLFRVPGSTPARSYRPSTSHGLPSLIAASVCGVHSRERPTARYVPSSTFLTSSTASSSAYLCGFVSPRSHVQGSLFRVFPSHPAARARRSPLPSCRWLAAPAEPLKERLQNDPPAFRALLQVRVRGDTQWVRPRPARSPLELFLPRVCLHAPCRKPSSPAPTTAFLGPRRVARA